MTIAMSRCMLQCLLGAYGENRVRVPIELMRRRRWGVCGQSIL